MALGTIETPKPAKKSHRKKPAPAKTDTAAPSAATAPAKSDTAPRPKKLPHLPINGLVNNAATDPPIPWAPGFHLSTCGNDSKQRSRYAGVGWHMCKPGEGYVADEGMCDTVDGFLTYNGDCVMAMNEEDYQRLKVIKGANTQRARRQQAEADKAEIEVISRRQGTPSAHIPGEHTITHEIGRLSDPDTITI